MHLFSKENIWSNPHASSIHPVIQTSTIILWTELFPKKRREKIQGEILQSIFKYSGVSTNNTRLIPCHPVQTNTRHLPATAPVHPSIPSGSQHRIHTTPKTTRSRNTGQDSLLRQFIPGQHRAGLSKIICPKTYQQDIWCFRTISPRTGIVTQLVPRHINKIYGVPIQQDNRSQDRNHYIQNSTRIHSNKVKYCISMQY